MNLYTKFKNFRKTYPIGTKLVRYNNIGDTLTILSHIAPDHSNDYTCLALVKLHGIRVCSF